MKQWGIKLKNEILGIENWKNDIKGNENWKNEIKGNGKKKQ